MFISRTPFRVSFVGGGTDLPGFYARETGSVISMTIDKYVFITVNQRFDDTIRVSYSQTEIVDNIDQVRHPLFRETARHMGVSSGIEVTSIADVPSGSGLGSSSSFTVGLLHALAAFRGEYRTPHELAADACHLEMEVLGEPIGKQDQYAAAFGGLRKYQFNPDGSVYVDHVICSGETKRKMMDHLLFFYLGGSRDARQVLQQQAANTANRMEFLLRIRGLVEDFWKVLMRGKGWEDAGEVLHEAWLCKKQLADNISNGRIDEIYERARAAGAWGGKILGAGIAGFLMLMCDPRKQPAVLYSLRDLRRVEFGFEPEGSKIVYVGN